jgi:type IV secretion system protein VirB6
MAVIEEVLNLVDTAVANLVGQTFAQMSISVQPVVAVASVLVIALVGANVITQTVAISMANALSVGLRIVLVNVFLGYVNYSTVYNALTNAPAEVGAGMLNAISGGQVDNLYLGLDALYSQALGLGDAIAQNGGWFAGALTSVVLFLVAALMATITIIVLAATKIMLALLLAIAPVMIALTLFKQSAPVFEAWVKLALGFAFVPLLVAAMAGFIIATAQRIAPNDIASVEQLSDTISFIVVMMLGTGLLLQVPTIAQSLAATGIGLGAVASRAQGAPARAFGRATVAARATADMVSGARAGWGENARGVYPSSSNSARAASASAALAYRMFAKQDSMNALNQAKADASRAKGTTKGPTK